MSTLYRKYRPQVFDEVVGQDHVIKTLKRAIESGRVAHAYLFCGPRGVGKTTVARILAKAVNCTNPPAGGPPCGKCANCLAIAEGNFIDLIEIDAASNRGIDEMRDLRDKIRFTPSIGKKKVYIIDEVHMLTREAFNALLKTLEEPPEHTIFIFATTEVHKLPQTVISRCQRFDFHLGEKDLVRESLRKMAKAEKVKLSEEILDLLVKVSGGSYRDAHSLLGQIMPHLAKDDLTLEEALKILNISGYGQVVEFLEILRSADAKGAIDYLAGLAERGTDFEQFLTALIGETRAEMIEKVKGGKDTVWERSVLDRLLVASQQLKFSPSEVLVLELAALDILKIKDQNVKTQIKNEKDGEKDDLGSNNQQANMVEIAVGVPQGKSVVGSLESVDHSLSLEQKLAIIESVSAKNKPLGVLLGSSQINLVDEVLHILVEYPLYKAKITSKTQLPILEKEADAVLGFPVKIKCDLLLKEDIAGEISEVFGVN